MSEPPQRQGAPMIVSEVPTLSPSQSGILLPTSATISGQRITDGNHSRDQIMSALLLWDTIVYPSNTAIAIFSKDVEVLKELGALKVVTVQIEGGTDAILAGEQIVFDRLLETSPNRWAVMPAAGGRFIRSRDLTKEGGAAFSLLDAIPLPTREVPFEDVLEFRHHRRDELLALRAHINSLANEISRNPNSQDGLHLAVKKLDQTISDQLRVTQESFGAFSLIRLKVGFNASDAFKEAVLAGGSAAWAHLDLLTVAGLAGLAGARAGVKFDLDLEGFKRARSNSPYEYVVNAHTELG